MSVEAESPLRRAWTNDGVKVLTAMFAIYALFLLFGAALGYQANGYANTLRRLTFLTAVYGLSVLALNLQWGYTGLFNIGVAGFMAVGAYTFAMLTAAPNARIPGLGMWWPFALIVAMFVAALSGLLAALPALRLRADYLAIVTVALSEIIRYLYLSSAFQTFTIAGVKLGTGGGSGIGIITHPADVIPELVLENPAGEALLSVFENMGIVSNVIAGWVYALFLLLVVAATYWLVMRIGFSPFGRVLKAIREDEDVANALGKNTRMFKTKSFMVGCGLMGLAGILWQASFGFINPDTFRPETTFFVWIALIIGGAGSNTGTLLGAALFTSILFEAPRMVGNIVGRALSVGGAPNNFAAAVGALGHLDVTPLIGYAINNLGPLRLVLMGIVLVWLMQNRPEGLLGHRKENAASIDISQPRRRTGATAADGGGEHE